MEKGTARKIWQLIEPVVRHDGYDVVDVEVHGNRNSVVRIFLDSPNGISVEKCAEFSRTFSSVLDVEDPFPGKYTLEVSSPGLERPLRKPADFQRFVGQRVAVKTNEKFRGVLQSADDEGFTVKIDGGEERKTPYDALEKAHILYDFTPLTATPKKELSKKQSSKKDNKQHGVHKN